MYSFIYLFVGFIFPLRHHAHKDLIMLDFTSEKNANDITKTIVSFKKKKEKSGQTSLNIQFDAVSHGLHLFHCVLSRLMLCHRGVSVLKARAELRHCLAPPHRRHRSVTISSRTLTLESSHTEQSQNLNNLYSPKSHTAGCFIYQPFTVHSGAVCWVAFQSHLAF